MPVGTATTFAGIRNWNEIYSHRDLFNIFSGDVREPSLDGAAPRKLRTDQARVAGSPRTPPNPCPRPPSTPLPVRTRIAARGEGHGATGGAGSLVLLNCRTIHGSVTNRSDRSRPLLLVVYSSADSYYTANPIPSPLSGRVVRGEPARWASVDCEVPPDWSAGYSGPWAHQAQSPRAREGRRERCRDTDRCRCAGCRGQPSEVVSCRHGHHR